MKGKIARHRRVRKYLNFYKNNFEFSSPYQIIIDGSFHYEALACKLNIQEQVPKYLGEENVKLCTTSCAIKEFECLGKKEEKDMDFMKECEVKECDHKQAPVPAAECIFSLVGNTNPNHFIIATQNQEFIDKCRPIPCIPLMYVRYNAVSLENPTVVSTERVKRKASQGTLKPQQKKIKTTKGPNPHQNKWQKNETLGARASNRKHFETNKRKQFSKVHEKVNKSD